MNQAVKEKPRQQSGKPKKDWQASRRPYQAKPQVQVQSHKNIIVTAERAVSDGVSGEQLRNIADWHRYAANQAKRTADTEREGERNAARHLSIARELESVAARMHRQ